MLNYMWVLENGLITYQSAIFYSNQDDSERKVIINGTPPANLINEDHIFYHRVIVPFMNKLNIDTSTSFDNKENAEKSLKILSGKVELKFMEESSTGPKVSTSPEDNIIHVDFNRTHDDS